MAYVGRPKEGGEQEQGCLFCVPPGAGPVHDRERLIVLRGERVYVMLNRYPYSNGHLMIVPNAHAPSLEDLDLDTAVELMALLKRSLRALRETLRPDGFNVGANLGKVAGAGIEGHVHVHVVPRWLGDNNFVPVLDGTRLIPQMLEDTYEMLQRAGLRSGR